MIIEITIKVIPLKPNERIIQLRQKLGLSGNQLAKLAGMAQSTVSSIESGKTSPTVESLERICHALGITLSDFFADDSDQFPPDLLQLIETAKKLTPEERKKLNDLLQTVLERTDRNER